jgi:hypothetical protein
MNHNDDVSDSPESSRINFVSYLRDRFWDTSIHLMVAYYYEIRLILQPHGEINCLNTSNVTALYDCAFLRERIEGFGFFALSLKQQRMPMSTYERTNREMLVFAGHAQESRATNPQTEEYRSVRC